MAKHWLLLESNGHGLAMELLPERTPGGVPRTGLGMVEDKFDIRVEPRGNSELRESSRIGGELAYGILWREDHVRRAASVAFAVADRTATINGRSADLLFALASAQAIRDAVARHAQQPEPTCPAFAATGVLDSSGYVRRVDGMPAKLRDTYAALAEEGCQCLFYPRENQADLPPDLRAAIESAGLKLHPVERLEQALAVLSFTIEKVHLESPYQGLSAFTYAERRVYFGRAAEADALRQALLQREQTGRAAALILGVSGSGKSSLAQAGLIPALEPQSQTDEHSPLIARPIVWSVWRPGEVPAHVEAARTLDNVSLRNEADLARAVHEHWLHAPHASPLAALDGVPVETLSDLASAFAQRVSQNSRFVWVVDQLEELFTQRFEPAAIQRFAEFLAELQNQGVWVVGTLRSDFYPHYQEYLLDAFPKFCVHDLGRLDDAALQAIIETPAARAGVEFALDPLSQKSLAAQLRQDALAGGRADLEGVLPLLEFTLAELYQARDPNSHRMTFEAYYGQDYPTDPAERTPGLYSMIGRRADAVLDGLDAEARAELPRLLRALATTAGIGHAARAARLDAYPQPSPARRLIDAFTAPEVRLWVLGKGGAADDAPITLRVAHEALLNHWPLAQAILRAQRQDLETLERLAQDAALWHAQGAGADLLLPAGKRLSDGADLLQREPDWLRQEGVADYVTASIQAEQARQTAERTQQRRRVRQAWTAAGVTSLLALGATGAGWWAWQAKHAADFHRGEAESLINYMLFDLRDKLRNVGRSDLLDDVAIHVQDHFAKSMARGELNSRELSAQGAAANNRGKALQTQGHLVEALDEYRKSLEISRKLVLADPTQTAWQRNLSVNHVMIGTVLEAQGQPDAAMLEHRRSLEILQNLVKTNPDNTILQHDLAANHDLIGGVLQSRGQLDDALIKYRQALDITQSLAKTDPYNSAWQSGLWASHNNIGDVLRLQGRLDMALVEYRQALDITQSLAQADPSNIVWQNNLLVSHNNTGAVLKAQNHLDNALGEYQRGLAIAQKLAQVDPSNTDWQGGLWGSHNNVGAVLQVQDRMDNALGEYQQALEIAKRQAQVDPSNTAWQFDLWNSHEMIGAVLQAQGRLDDAMGEYRQDQAIAQRLAQANPSNTAWQRYLSVSHEKIGEILQAQDHLDDALGEYRQALDIGQPLVLIDSSNAQWQDGLAFIHANIASILRQQHHVNAALAEFRQAAALLAPLVERAPNLAQWKQALDDVNAAIAQLDKAKP